MWAACRGQHWSERLTQKPPSTLWLMENRPLRKQQEAAFDIHFSSWVAVPIDDYWAHICSPTEEFNRKMVVAVQSGSCPEWQGIKKQPWGLTHWGTQISCKESHSAQPYDFKWWKTFTEMENSLNQSWVNKRVPGIVLVFLFMCCFWAIDSLSDRKESWTMTGRLLVAVPQAPRVETVAAVQHATLSFRKQHSGRMSGHSDHCEGTWDPQKCAEGSKHEKYFECGTYLLVHDFRKLFRHFPVVGLHFFLILYLVLFDERSFTTKAWPQLPQIAWNGAGEEIKAWTEQSVSPTGRISFLSKHRNNCYFKRKTFPVCVTWLL